MPITGSGWEFHVVRHTEPRTAPGGRRRTVGRYQVFHDGVAQTGAGLSGTVAETKGPGANSPVGNGRRIEEGRYPLSTQDGQRYCTIGYRDSENPHHIRKPALLLGNTGDRIAILIHPGIGFLSSIGCFNPCTSLPNAAEPIDFVPSRRRALTNPW